MTTGAGSFFDAMAASYDELEPWYEHLYGILHGLGRAELAPPAGSRRPRALDAGCGTGFQTAILQELGYETLGVDLSAALLGVARGRRTGAGFVQGDLEMLPCRDAAFDIAVSCGSTLSFVARADRAIAEIARALRPGGRLLLEVEHRWSPDLLWRLASSVAGDPLGYEVTPREARRAFARPLREGVWMDYPGYPRLRLFTRRELERLLVAAGLAPVRVWGLHSVTNLIPSTVLHRPRLGRVASAVYPGLRALDRALAATPFGCGLANSLVVLAAKRGPYGPAEARSADPTRGAAPLPDGRR